MKSILLGRSVDRSAPTPGSGPSLHPLPVRAALITLFCACSCAYFSTLGALPASGAQDALRVPMVTPWMDRHDRIEEIAARLEPAVRIERFSIEREGSFKKSDWFPAFGFPSVVPLDGPLVILEAAAATALDRLVDSNGESLTEALPKWVRAGGHLLIVGGSTSIESYAGTPFESLMGFVPDSNPAAFLRRRQRPVRLAVDDKVHVSHLHSGKVTAASIRLRAGKEPFVLDHPVGRGHVTTVLSGVLGSILPDGGVPKNEWFRSTAWTDFMIAEIGRASGKSHRSTRRSSEPPAVRPPARSDFDIRHFLIANRPYPFTLAPGEAHARAAELRGLGFTSVVVASSGRNQDDLRALAEVTAAGLRVVYFDGITRKAPKRRVSIDGGPPKKAMDAKGKEAGWDIHSPAFRASPRHLLDGREAVGEMPLRAIQVVEEFPDGSRWGWGPTLEKQLSDAGIKKRPKEGTSQWIEVAAMQSDATARTLQDFRAAGQALFPGMPQSTYWPGSYWNRPGGYGYRLTVLAEIADELLAPAYAYAYRDPGAGVASVQRAMSEIWAASQPRPNADRHLAVYALGRQLGRNSIPPGPRVWRETAWTALAHGATGLAYWALPSGAAIESLGPLHEEIARIGPWLKPLPRRPAPVAVLESWTTRTEGNLDQRKLLARCLQTIPASIEIGFEDLDLVLEEDLASLPDATRGIVIAGTPALSPQAATALEAFLARGGHLFIEDGSAVRTQPGARRLELDPRGRHVAQIHPVPLRGTCKAVKRKPRRGAASWNEALREAGLEPRVSTKAPGTAATLRGGPELWHLYALNHEEDPTSVTVDLPDELRRLRWRDLRSGDTPQLSPDGRLTTARPVQPGEAAVFAAARREARDLGIRVETGKGNTGNIRLFAADAKGAPVADGYPIRVSTSDAGDCVADNRGAATFVSGRAEIRLVCAGSDPSAIAWTAHDPITGKTTRSRPDR